jgi:hypothetical protein
MVFRGNVVGGNIVRGTNIVPKYFCSNYTCYGVHNWLGKVRVGYDWSMIVIHRLKINHLTCPYLDGAHSPRLGKVRLRSVRVNN